MNYINSEVKHNKCAGKALVISGLAMLSAILQTVFLPFILAPIAMILSHISKGRTKSRPNAAKVATLISIGALFVNVFIIGFNVYLYYNNADYRNQLNQTYESMTGMTLEEYYEDLLSSYQLPYTEVK